MTDRKYSPVSHWGDDAKDGDPEETFHKLTREEAAAWRTRNPMVSPWRVVAVQGAVGLVVKKESMQTAAYMVRANTGGAL
jgi:hypothetical protein